MKTSQLAALAAASCSLCALAPDRLAAQTIPSIPMGVVSAYPTVVQTGTKPMLTWSILYPSTVGDVATVTLPGTLTTTEPIFVAVQIIGTGVTSGDTTQGSTPLNTEVRMSINGGSYVQLFYGTQAAVDPTQYLYTKKLDDNVTIDFGGRCVKNNAWTPFYTTKSANQQVVALVNGDTPPTNSPLHQSSNLASYLKPYLDASGKVMIGPMSVLIMMELGQTNHNASSFDYQDQIILVSFSTKNPKNNGHGNNIDGVDSSNPGNGSGGPNGGIDPSGGVDDER